MSLPCMTLFSTQNDWAAISLKANRGEPVLQKVFNIFIENRPPLGRNIFQNFQIGVTVPWVYYFNEVFV